MERSKSPQSTGDNQTALFAALTNSQNIALLSFIAALLIAIIAAFSTKRSSKARGNVLVLVGPPDAGKTTILSNLVYGQSLPTHTSLQVNSSVVQLSISQKNVRVVDIPGHPRIRDQFREHLDDAKAIAFVVDASTVSRNAAVVAEHLHNILHTLTSLPPSHPLPTVTVLAHKYDLLSTGSQSNSSADSLAVNRVKSVLERELEKRRASQSGGVGVEGLGAEGEKLEMGGLDCNGPAGGAFRFSDWEGGEIPFVGTSAKVSKAVDDPEKEGEDGLAALKDWLDEHM